MLIDPRSLDQDPTKLEEIEKTSLRLVSQAVFDFRDEAVAIFHNEGDYAADIGEDLTREALDRIGVSRVNQRLFGKFDYKRARYLFHPDYAIKQALFVDSKAEKITEKGKARIQTSQTSMIIKQVRSGQAMEVPGTLPTVIETDKHSFLTTTIFVKYSYSEIGGQKELATITIAALPSGFLQDKYNPTVEDRIWDAGPNAPARGEAFRTRLSFPRLKAKCRWRVQYIGLTDERLLWDE